MQGLTPDGDLDAFFAGVAAASARVLMLDYDGTLAPFQIDPARAVPYPGVVPLLDAIVAGGGTRVVIVSGRPADEVPPLLKLAHPAEIWGAHGRERLRPDGRRTIAALAPDARRELAAAAAALTGTLPAGARVEEKLASIALHWRGMPAAEADALERRVSEAWREATVGGMLELLPFDKGLELRIAGCSKRSAVEAILTEADARSAIAYLGDDFTDEDAFRALKGRGLRVLVRRESRPTDADVWIEPPGELLEFLERWRSSRAR